MSKGENNQEAGKSGSRKARRPATKKTPPVNDTTKVSTRENEPLPITKQQLPIEKMEVHHHPDVEKKGLKEYLLEGLMIFVAVTMGFFAESLREHINEHTRAREFAATMYIDLNADSADLSSYLKYTHYAANNVDTLLHLLSTKDIKQIPSGELYWFGLWGGAHRIFIPHDATLLQMKSSASLRYFSNATINRKVAQYDQLSQRLKTFETNEQGIYTEVRKVRALLFDFKYNEDANNFFLENEKSFKQARIDSFKRSNPPLLSYDKQTFNQYIEMVRSRFIRTKLAYADTLYNHAIDLKKALKKEYKLEDK